MKKKAQAPSEPMLGQRRDPNKEPDAPRTDPLPSQYELCQIAAAVLGPEAAKQPLKAVRAALGLWFSAAYELPRAAKRNWEANAEIYGDAGHIDTDELINVSALEEYRELQELERETIQFGVSVETSDAMRWLDANAEDPRDQFKTFPKFVEAWGSVFGDERDERGDEARLVCCRPLLQRLIEVRVAHRKAADAARKRKNRARNKTGDNLSKKSVPDKQRKRAGLDKRNRAPKRTTRLLDLDNTAS
jgi:hypothetical protein